MKKYFNVVLVLIYVLFLIILVGCKKQSVNESDNTSDITVVEEPVLAHLEEKYRQKYANYSCLIIVELYESSTSIQRYDKIETYCLYEDENGIYFLNPHSVYIEKDHKEYITFVEAEHEYVSVINFENTNFLVVFDYAQDGDNLK